jgi:hypothetical protein
MTGRLLRRLQELAARLCEGVCFCSRVTKEANLAGGPSECNRHSIAGDRA